MLVPLKQEGILTLSGAKSQHFLQGQSTCDVLADDIKDSVRYGACCTPKGRAVCVFMMISPPSEYIERHCKEYEDAEQTGSLLLLRMPRDVVGTAQNFLARFAVFDKVKVEDGNELWNGLGIIGKDGIAAAQKLWTLPEKPGAYLCCEEVLIVRRDAERLECWCRESDYQALYDKLSAQLPEADQDTWYLHEIRSGMGNVYAATAEKFLPQMLNLEAWDGISYTKGCYTGQEVVARAHHLGALKRHLVHAKGSGATAIEVGDTLHDAKGAQIGDVVSAAAAGQDRSEYELLAVIGQKSGSEDCYLKETKLTIVNQFAAAR